MSNIGLLRSRGYRQLTSACSALWDGNKLKYSSQQRSFHRRAANASAANVNAANAASSALAAGANRLPPCLPRPSQTTTSDLPRKPAGRSALAPSVGGEAGRPPQRDGGRTRGQDPPARGVQPLGHPAGGVKETKTGKTMSIAEAEDGWVCASSTAERGDGSQRTSSDIGGLREELPGLPGEPGLQRTQPDPAGPPGEPAGVRGGKWTSLGLDGDHRS